MTGCFFYRFRHLFFLISGPAGVGTYIVSMKKFVDVAYVRGYRMTTEWRGSIVVVAS
ncbi:hypothetical protein P691DRAFT_355779 [Macrolepiota fuliginosa MF-IS2]|uniref:Uncharacterized protein n=1 Tax=Macrolepiota fuliginosa MF-IS2 TaxID=1400762 RepID=A0A9P5X6W2_9AGAR|nr:hypothetical protein P691DRAFT_355779 [Macrolepiota fuliginosa MF-IS2]